MQPTYLPWMGYFDLIDQSDLFVFLDNVQFDNRSWQQRNRIKMSQGPHWLTVPVYQRTGQKITDVRIYNEVNWRRKHWMTLTTGYQKSAFWSDVSPQLEGVYQQDWQALVDLNIYLIKLFCQMLGIESNFKRASQLESIRGKKTDLLISICQSVGADLYLSPAGSKTYLTSDNHFKNNGIALKFHQYEHPTYPQLYGEFSPYLSIVDLMMNTGEKVLDTIISGRK
jgi:hypothetical protein